MSEQSNINTIQDLYSAFGRGDVATILNHLTDDIRWVSHLDSIVPWAGDFSGKARVPKFFDAIFHSVDVEVFNPQEWVAQGDTVISIGEFGCKGKATGKSTLARWIFIWKFKDGRVASYEQFEDPVIADAFR